MERKPPRFLVKRVALDLEDLLPNCRLWLLHCEIEGHTARTIANRREVVNKLWWFLQSIDASECGEEELGMYLAYLHNGHKEPGGRWGNPYMTKPLSRVSIVTYQGHLRSFWNWMVYKGYLENSAMEAMPKTRDPERNNVHKIQPFNAAQIEALLNRARKTDYPARNCAIIGLLLDTGIRVSEMCGLTFAELDMDRRLLLVHGKGEKDRNLAFSARTAQSLYTYLAARGKQAGVQGYRPQDQVFRSERGRQIGDGLTRSGVLRMLSRIGAAAGLKLVRCSPHTLRHTFAVEFLRGGGNPFTLQIALGHEDMKMTQKYVKLVEADVIEQMRKFSPVERMLGKGKR